MIDIGDPALDRRGAPPAPALRVRDLYQAEAIAPHLAFWYMYYSGIDRNIFALATGGGKVMGTEGNLRAIQKIRPHHLAAMPTFLYHVLTQAVDEKLRIEGVRGVLFGGEKVADGTRRKVAELLAQLGSQE